MKKLKLITMFLFTMLTTTFFGQSVSEVVSLDSTITKETLFSNALSFFATTFKSAQNVIQMKDPETGKVIGKGLLSNGRKVTITISCKKGKYKYDIEYDLLGEKPINMNIDKCGVLKGITYLPITFNNGKPFLDINKIYFTATGQTSCNNCWKEGEYILHYDGSNNVMGLSKSAIEKWRVLVDEQFKVKQLELSNLTPKNDVELDNLILTLKNEMSKSDW